MRIPSASVTKALTILTLGLVCLVLGGVEFYRFTQLRSLQSLGKCDYLACGPATEPSLLAVAVLGVVGVILALTGAWLFRGTARRGDQTDHSA